MTPKIKLFKNGAWVVMGAPSFPQGLTEVIAYGPAGQCLDRTRCDTRRIAGEYFRAFCKLAKNS